MNTNEIVVHPASLCALGLFLSLLAFELRYLLTEWMAPATNAPKSKCNSPSEEQHMFPKWWIVLLTAPADLAAISLCSVGAAYLLEMRDFTNGIGYLLSIPCLYGIHRVMKIFPTDQFLERRITIMERSVVRKVVTIVAPLCYRLTVWWYEVEPAAWWYLPTIAGCIVVLFIHPMITTWWEDKGYNINGSEEYEDGWNNTLRDTEDETKTTQIPMPPPPHG